MVQCNISRASSAEAESQSRFCFKVALHLYNCSRRPWFVNELGYPSEPNCSARRASRPRLPQDERKLRMRERVHKIVISHGGGSYKWCDLSASARRVAIRFSSTQSSTDNSFALPWRFLRRAHSRYQVWDARAYVNSRTRRVKTRVSKLTCTPDYERVYRSPQAVKGSNAEPMMMEYLRARFLNSAIQAEQDRGIIRIPCTTPIQCLA